MTRCACSPPTPDNGGPLQPEITTIVIPPGMWLDIDHDGSCLKCVINVNGTFMHLDAIQVYYSGRERRQRPVARRLQEDFELLCRYGSEGQFATTDINGKPYVLVATSFA